MKIYFPEQGDDRIVCSIGYYVLNTRYRRILSSPVTVVEVILDRILNYILRCSLLLTFLLWITARVCLSHCQNNIITL